MNNEEKSEQCKKEANEKYNIENEIFTEQSLQTRHLRTKAMSLNSK